MVGAKQEQASKPHHEAASKLTYLVAVLDPRCPFSGDWECVPISPRLVCVKHPTSAGGVFAKLPGKSLSFSRYYEPRALLSLCEVVETWKGREGERDRGRGLVGSCHQPKVAASVSVSLLRGPMWLPTQPRRTRSTKTTRWVRYPWL